MLKSIKTSNFRSIGKSGIRIQFNDIKKHGVIVGPNGCGKTNFIRSLFKTDRNSSDIPFSGSDFNGVIELGFLFNDTKVTKSILYPQNQYSIKLEDGWRDKLNEIGRTDHRNKVDHFFRELAKLKEGHSIGSFPNNSATIFIDRASLDYVNKFSISPVPDILKWSSSLTLNLDSFNSPDGLMKYLKDKLSNVEKDHFEEYLSGNKLDDQIRSSLHDKLNELLNDFSEPVQGLDLEIGRYMQLDENEQLQIMTKQDSKFVNFENRSDGESLIVSFLLMLEDLGINQSPQLILIDEVERRLDPSNQKLLAKLVSNVPSNLSFLVSTHSPYVYRNRDFTEKALLFISKKSDHVTSISSYEENDRRVLDYDSWAEINFLAYEVYSVEYHNELYGHIMMEKNCTFDELDDFFVNKGMVLKTYTRTTRNDNTTAVQQVCSYAPDCGRHESGKNNDEHCLPIATAIRHVTSHSENSFNDRVTLEELKTSTNKLREILKELEAEI